MPTRVLITGSRGFLGRALVKDLRANTPYEIVGMGRSSSDPAVDYEYHVADLADPSALQRIPGPFSTIIHLAGAMPPASDEEVFHSNVASTAALADIRRVWGAQRIVYASSGAVYDASRSGTVVDEDSVLKPRDLYGRSKQLAEDILSTALDSCCILRIGYLYGPGETRGLVSRMLYAANQGLAIALRNESRDFVHVADAAMALRLALDYSGSERVFNIGSGAPQNVVSLATELKRLRPDFEFSTDGARSNVLLDSAKARHLLGWMPIHSLRRELSDMLSGAT